MVILLATLGLFILGALANAGTEGPVTEARLSAARAFYAAEAGMNMAIRETMLASDLDGDGRVGTISDDANLWTDPDLGNGARVVVEHDTPPNMLRLFSRGRAGSARRVIQATIE
jgi:hypothetical protein